MAGSVAPKIALDAKDVRAKWDAVKEFSPRLARELRRELRKTGSEVITEQRRVLDGPLPTGIQVTGQTLRPTLNKKTGRVGVRKLNTYGDRAIQRPGRSTGLREGIKSGLVTRVTISKSRTSVQVRTTNAKKTGSNFWQSKKFRHPVFGNRQVMVNQRGMPFFWQPAIDGGQRMAGRINTAIDAAFQQIPSD
ncbi:hypothetical protein QN355_06300 [Cryobacterium sp. 10S3]|uniref:hypothetical protein n=1 Tax=Cryobacterium sp. 10S3 TaxID=3048582 RepID=UPI002AC8B641|nr:hypothetical protein [Cryobacterium sp. 10S3]MEB0286159.1 hypothetical protein [Cryobacterium sp. 10S3]WPX12217.1 hypothetical protein RHM57_11040 [Cryobacterium sp. 10S3]